MRKKKKKRNEATAVRTRQGRSKAAQGGEGKRSDTDADADAVCDKLKSGGPGPGLGLGGPWAGLDDEVTRYTITARETAGGVVETLSRGGEVAPFLFSFFSKQEEPPTQQASAGCRVVGAPRQVHDDPPTSLAPS